MLKLLLNSLCFCIISISGFSQENNIWKDYPNLGIMQYSVILDDVSEEENIYQNPEFQTSELTTKENRKLSAIKIRYNIKKDVMECKIGSQHSIINSPEKLKEVTINGETFEYKKYLVKKDTINGYLKKLSDGDQKIYAKYYLPTNGTLDIQNQKSYYLVQEESEIPTKKGSANTLISKYYKSFLKEAKEFENKNQLNLDIPRDFKKLLTYLDQLSKDIVASR
ncbi:hypothetical protein BZG02_13090 [Labilibaculum filiforme]|uniref:Uncharacterized protein n=1 Tax=Labilibaculum filiforme TaxID=1940526 RepID=A0A2N3HW32_9BACT|nr:hypothetical protein [Labilibaculum filiforme]PKQ62247.1 hypothetical protein BZG02_13090 [Labilibaculum filiforme]